jgi:hypothetical protein
VLYPSFEMLSSRRPGTEKRPAADENGYRRLLSIFGLILYQVVEISNGNCENLDTASGQPPAGPKVRTKKKNAKIQDSPDFGRPRY